MTTVAYFAAACIPQVNAIAQPNSEDIMWRPIDEVEVEVVLQSGRIQHLQATARKFNSAKTQNCWHEAYKFRIMFVKKRLF